MATAHVSENAQYFSDVIDYYTSLCRVLYQPRR